MELMIDSIFVGGQTDSLSPSPQNSHTDRQLIPSDRDHLAKRHLAAEQLVRVTSPLSIT